MLCDLFTEPTYMHCSSLYHPLAVTVAPDEDAITYEPMGDRWEPEDTISMGGSIESQAVSLLFDASRVSDNLDFVGRFADSNAWHRRRIRLTLLSFVAGSSQMTPIAPVCSWEGNMDFRDFPEVIGSPPKMALTLESGTFRYVGRNLQTRTDENQQRLFPDDVFFQDLPGLIGRELPWQRAWTAVSQNRVVVSGAAAAGEQGNRYYLKD